MELSFYDFSPLPVGSYHPTPRGLEDMSLPRRVDNDYTTWSFRVVDATSTREERGGLVLDDDMKLGYVMWGYCVHPVAHVLGLVEFSEPKSSAHLIATLRNQFDGAYATEPLDSMRKVRMVWDQIKDVRSLGGIWTALRNPDEESSSGEYSYSDEESVDALCDPVEVIADIGASIVARVQQSQRHHDIVAPNLPAIDRYDSWSYFVDGASVSDIVIWQTRHQTVHHTWGHQTSPSNMMGVIHFESPHSQSKVVNMLRALYPQGTIQVEPLTSIKQVSRSLRTVKELSNHYESHSRY